MFSSLKSKLAVSIAALWVRSLRIRMCAPSEFAPGVLGLWHRDLLACTACFKDQNVHVLISESGDGELFARLAEKLNYQVTRGSDSHGAMNVRHLCRSLRQGRFVGMALDGPRGPALEVKPGSPWLAETTGRPFWFIDVHYGPHICLKGWDRFVIPLPLSVIDISIKYFRDLNFQHKSKELPS